MPELALEKIDELTRMIYATSLMTPTTKLGLSTRVKGRPNALRERYAAPSTSTTGDWVLSFFRWFRQSHFATWNPKNFPGPLRTYLSGYPLAEITVHMLVVVQQAATTNVGDHLFTSKAKKNESCTYLSGNPLLLSMTHSIENATPLKSTKSQISNP